MSIAYRSISLILIGFGAIAPISGFAQAGGSSQRQTPTVVVTPSSSSIANTQAISVTVAVTGSSGSALPTGAVVLNSGGYSLPPNLPYTMPALNGLYNSKLTTAALTAASGLSNATINYADSSGTIKGTATGLVAASPGQAGTGSIPFPAPMDATRPARINVHICIGSSTASPDDNQLAIYFSNGANPANGLYFSAGMNSIQLQMWGKTELASYGSGSIPSGTCGSVFMDWIGTGPGGVDAQGNEQVWAGWIPDDATDLQAPNNTAVPSAYQPTALGFSAKLDPSMLSNTTGIFISNSSSNSMVTGVFVSQGRLDGPADGAMPVPGLFQPFVLDAGNIIPSYQANEVWIPPSYGNPSGNPIVQTYHPNGSVADIRYGRLGVYANLFNAGYVLAAVTGDNGNGYSAWGGANYASSPTSTSWGGPSGGQYRTAVMGLVRQYLPNGNQYFRMGLSAGAADALTDEMRNPGASGIALYSGVISLTGAWNQAGQSAPGGGTYGSFLPNIQYGWGDWYLSLQGSNTNQAPASSPSYWTRLSSTLTGLPLSYYNAWEFAQRGAWNPATTYSQNDIAVSPYAGTSSGLAAGDPALNLSSFKRVPIQAWAEENDSTIMSPAWQTAFIDGLNAAGNNNVVSNILTDCPPAGGCHLSSGVLNPTSNQPWNATTAPSPTLAWFNSLRTPWSLPSSGSFTSSVSSLNNGSTTIELPAGSLSIGTNTLTATYTPDSASSANYNGASGSYSVVVSLPKITPAVTIALSASSITTAQGLTVTVAVGGAPTPNGSIMLSSGNYTSAAFTLSSGGATVSIPAGSLAAGADTLSVSYTPDSSSSAIYNSATGTTSVTVTAAVSPSFAISGTAVTVTPGATAANTSTITLTPGGGFNGSIALTAAIGLSPAGAQNLPSLSFGSTTPVIITGASGGSATLTISTTVATSSGCIAANHGPRTVPWYAGGSAVLACVLLIGVPKRRRWLRMIGAVALLFALAGGTLACGGGSGGSRCVAVTNPGTTAGSYTITVTGTSGATTGTGTVALTVE